MTNRKLSELGINPLLGYVLCAVVFIAIFEFAFLKTEVANYPVVLAAAALLLRMSAQSRTEFLEIVFGSKKSRRIRIVENLLACLPFVMLLIFHALFIEAAAVLVAGFVFAFYAVKIGFNYSMPTPFYKRLFEFAVGFRKTFFVFPVLYGLIAVAISVDNFNLAIAVLLLHFVVVLTYYTKPEEDYFVWIYSVKPSAFLFGKLRTASVYTLFLVLPAVISLGVFYADHIFFTLLFSLVGFTFLWTLILAKYSAFPQEMNFPEAIPIALSMFFPPLLLALIPFFYSKSVKNLNSLLK